MTKQNNKPKLYIMCGISGSGKSTTAKQIAEKENCVIVSSDAIRAEICEGGVYDQSKNEEVFKIFHDRIRKNLVYGRNVIADATSITMKSRRAILEEVKNIDCEKICYIIAKPYEDCVKDNNNSDRNPVPEEVIKKQMMKFQVPFKEEGYDDIIVHDIGDGYIWSKFIHDMDNFDQKNPHHSMTLLEHCLCTYRLFFKKYYPEAKTVGEMQYCELCDGFMIGARLHDYGKLFCQTFDEDGIAHYYGHENVGSYKILTEMIMPYTTWDTKRRLDCCFLINYHMFPMNWNTEKAQNKWKKIFGEGKYQILVDFNECDKARPDIEKTN